MDDLISREAATETARKCSVKEVTPSYMLIDKAEIMTELMMLPSAEPEHKTGRWEITDAYPHNVYCSECHKKFAQTHWAVWEDGSLPRKFCPNCGAKMEARDED